VAAGPVAVILSFKGVLEFLGLPILVALLLLGF
jgi:hypothetical protein